jgi:hypothetical protein
MREVIVEEIGASAFNDIVVPILSLHTVILTGGLAVLFALWGFLAMRWGRSHTPKHSGPRYRRN